jgi:16S rRNA A1518/A1519 N6-dimethyltransferase RsmA/KsgA/DIM1 with predicted DNA glycosylase/AP lyase activity
LSNYFGSSSKVDEVLAKAGVDSSLRGEQLDLNQFLAIAKAAGE